MVSGDVLLSHTVASAVPSALLGLTSLFEMGRGVSPAILSPGNSLYINSGGQMMLQQEKTRLPIILNLNIRLNRTDN